MSGIVRKPTHSRPAAYHTAAADALHGRFFTAVSRLPGSASRTMLRWLFDLKYLRRDPWRYERRDDAARRCAAIATVCRGELAEHLLEIGCGEGHLTERLLETECAHRITGIDVSHRAVKRARARVGDRASFVHADARYSDLPPSDLIVVTDVLYYMGDARDVATAVSRMVDALVPGGRLVLCHPKRWATQLHVAPDATIGLRRIESTVYSTPAEVHIIDVWRRI